MTRSRTVRATLERSARGLARRGVEEPRLDAELLLAAALATDRPGVYRRLEDRLPATGRTRLAGLLRGRRARIPIAYLLGRREFRDRSFAVGPGVLIPRPETEELVDALLDRVPPEAFVRVLDVGTGSGNIAVTVAKERPRARVVAIDDAPDALAFARWNVGALGVAERVALCRCRARDLTAVLRAERFDAVISNPPYVTRPPGGFTGELAHEPAAALCGDGASFPAIYRTLRDAAATLLVPGGWLLVEVGEGQAEVVRALFASGPFAGVEVLPDLAGIPRVILARRPGA